MTNKEENRRSGTLTSKCALTIEQTRNDKRGGASERDFEEGARHRNDDYFL